MKKRTTSMPSAPSVRLCASPALGGFLGRAEDLGLGDVLELDVAGHDLAVAELADDLEDLRPRRVHLLVDLLVGLNGHAELELLGGHLALLGGFAVVGTAAARAPARVYARGGWGVERGPAA